MSQPSTARATLVLGEQLDGFPLLPNRLTLTPSQALSHKHLIGVAGVGKSKLLESLFLQLLDQQVGVSLLDPHADGVEDILRVLVDRGFFDRPGAYDRLLYIDFADPDHTLPFNVLRQAHVDPHVIAANVLEAFHRAWPSLGDGAAPQFDNLLLAGTLVLIENGLPLPAMHRLLTDRSFRDAALLKVSDPDVVGFFRDRFDRWWKTEAPQMIESTLRRVFLLTFVPELKFALGQAENLLDFRQILDRGQAVLLNIGGIHAPDARRLLGCLITTGYESAALARTDLLAEERRPHHLLLDEFSDYSAQSEEALSRTLSLTRKFGLFSTMAHQTWSQASLRLQGALQNVGVRVVFRTGRADAELLARTIGTVDPLEVKREPSSPSGQPVFLELPAQWEAWTTQLTELPPRQALVKLPGQPARRIRTLEAARHRPNPGRVERVKQIYRQRLLRLRSEIVLVHQAASVSRGVRRAVVVQESSRSDE